MSLRDLDDVDHAVYGKLFGKYNASRELKIDTDNSQEIVIVLRDEQLYICYYGDRVHHGYNVPVYRFKAVSSIHAAEVAQALITLALSRELAVRSFRDTLRAYCGPSTEYLV